MKGWTKIFHANSNQKKARLVTLISDKMDFTSKTVAKDKERYLIVTRESIHQEDITIINMYKPTNNSKTNKAAHFGRTTAM